MRSHCVFSGALTGLRVPQPANIVRDLASRRQGHRLAAQLLADLVEQPRIADRAAPDHQAAGAGRVSRSCACSAEYTCPFAITGHGIVSDRLPDAIVVHGQPVHLRHGARVHGERVERVPREDPQQLVELVGRSEAEACLHRELDAAPRRAARRGSRRSAGARAAVRPRRISCRRWARGSRGSGQSRRRGTVAVPSPCGPAPGCRCRSSAR